MSLPFNLRGLPTFLTQTDKKEYLNNLIEESKTKKFNLLTNLYFENGDNNFNIVDKLKIFDGKYMRTYLINKKDIGKYRTYNTDPKSAAFQQMIEDSAKSTDYFKIENFFVNGRKTIELEHQVKEKKIQIDKQRLFESNHVYITINLELKLQKQVERMHNIEHNFKKDGECNTLNEKQQDIEDEEIQRTITLMNNITPIPSPTVTPKEFVRNSRTIKMSISQRNKLFLKTFKNIPDKKSDRNSFADRTDYLTTDANRGNTRSLSIKKTNKRNTIKIMNTHSIKQFNFDDDNISKLGNNEMMKESARDIFTNSSNRSNKLETVDNLEKLPYPVFSKFKFQKSPTILEEASKNKSLTKPTKIISKSKSAICKNINNSNGKNNDTKHELKQSPNKPKIIKKQKESLLPTEASETPSHHISKRIKITNRNSIANTNSMNGQQLDIGLTTPIIYSPKEAKSNSKVPSNIKVNSIINKLSMPNITSTDETQHKYISTDINNDNTPNAFLKRPSSNIQLKQINESKSFLLNKICTNNNNITDLNKKYGLKIKKNKFRIVKHKTNSCLQGNLFNDKDFYINKIDLDII